MFKGSKKYWIIAIMCGFVAAILSYQYIHSVKTRYTPGDLTTVVKARINIAKDTTITAEQIVKVEVPAKFSHPDALRELEDAIGKVAVTDISSGEEILRPNILSDSTKKGRMAYNIPEGKRAVSVSVDDVSGVAKYIMVGDKVDIMTTIDIGNGSETVPYTVLTLQNIQVLAIGSNKGEGKQTEEKPTLTLAVSVAEAQPLVLASERGKIRLLLRHPVDQSTTIVPPMQVRNFIQ